LGFFIGAAVGRGMRDTFWLGLGGLAGLAILAFVAGGALVGFLLWNDLLRGSPWTTAALGSVALVAGFVLVLVALAGPSRDWLDSPYW